MAKFTLKEKDGKVVAYRGNQVYGEVDTTKFKTDDILGVPVEVQDAKEDTQVKIPYRGKEGMEIVIVEKGYKLETPDSQELKDSENKDSDDQDKGDQNINKDEAIVSYTAVETEEGNVALKDKDGNIYGEFSHLQVGEDIQRLIGADLVLDLSEVETNIAVTIKTEGGLEFFTVVKGYNNEIESSEEAEEAEVVEKRSVRDIRAERLGKRSKKGARTLLEERLKSSKQKNSEWIERRKEGKQ